MVHYFLIGRKHLVELRYTRIINNDEVFTYFFIFDSGSSSNLGRSCVSSFTVVNRLNADFLTTVGNNR